MEKRNLSAVHLAVSEMPRLIPAGSKLTDYGTTSAMRKFFSGKP